MVSAVESQALGGGGSIHVGRVARAVQRRRRVDNGSVEWAGWGGGQTFRIKNRTSHCEIVFSKQF